MESASYKIDNASISNSPSLRKEGDDQSHTIASKLSSLESVTIKQQAKPELIKTDLSNLIEKYTGPFLIGSGKALAFAGAYAAIILAPLTLSGAALGAIAAKIAKETKVMPDNDKKLITTGLIIGSLGSVGILLLGEKLINAGKAHERQQEIKTDQSEKKAVNVKSELADKNPSSSLEDIKSELGDAKVLTNNLQFFKSLDFRLKELKTDNPKANFISHNAIKTLMADVEHGLYKGTQLNPESQQKILESLKEVKESLNDLAKCKNLSITSTYQTAKEEYKNVSENLRSNVENLGNNSEEVSKMSLDDLKIFRQITSIVPESSQGVSLFYRSDNFIKHFEKLTSTIQSEIDNAASDMETVTSNLKKENAVMSLLSGIQQLGGVTNESHVTIIGKIENDSLDRIKQLKSNFSEQDLQEALNGEFQKEGSAFPYVAAALRRKES